MKSKRGLAVGLAFLLFACQPASPPNVTLIDNGQVMMVQTNELVPSAILTQAGVTLGQNDRILFKGLPVQPDLPINDSPIVIQLRRAVVLTLVTPAEQKQILSSAFTVGEVLQEAGIQLHESDEVDPPVNTPINKPLTIHYAPSRDLTVTVDGRVVQIESSARTIGEALAGAGLPLLGFDQSLPSEAEALPPDGRIRVVRVSESVMLVQQPIPFETETIASTEVPLDQTQMLAPGENGLMMQRVRIRFEDGVEVSRMTEEETIVRPPKTRTLAYGTKVETRTALVDGVTIEYWRAVQMYATSYSPCNLGTSTCGSTTASGKQLQKGMVALRTDLYYSLRGQPLYIPGYGFATVEDACGGCVGKPWIDLGFTDAEYQPWHSWVTVYFLTPVPQSIPYDLE